MNCVCFTLWFTPSVLDTGAGLIYNLHRCRHWPLQVQPRVTPNYSTSSLLILPKLSRHRGPRGPREPRGAMGLKEVKKRSNFHRKLCHKLALRLHSAWSMCLVWATPWQLTARRLPMWLQRRRRGRGRGLQGRRAPLRSAAWLRGARCCSATWLAESRCDWCATSLTRGTKSPTSTERSVAFAYLLCLRASLA